MVAHFSSLILVGLGVHWLVNKDRNVDYYCNYYYKSKNSVLCIFVGLELATKTRRTKTFLMKSIKTAIMMVQKETSTQNFLT